MAIITYSSADLVKCASQERELADRTANWSWVITGYRPMRWDNKRELLYGGGKKVILPKGATKMWNKSSCLLWRKDTDINF